MEKISSCDFEAVKSVDLFVLVFDEDHVVNVQDESLKSVVVAFVWRPGFSVDCGVFVADVVVISPCEVGLSVSVQHCGCGAV